MSRIKRIITFTMAMVFCASFCLSINAEVWREEFNPGVTSAYAWVRITDWAIESNWTDLAASTVAYVEDYDYWEGFYDLTVYVDLYVQLSDEISIYSSSSYEDTYSGDTELEASVSGLSCLDPENHYSIIDFGTDHEVVVTCYVYDGFAGDYIFDYTNDGSVIHITP